MDGYLLRSFMEMMSRSIQMHGSNVGDEGLRRLTRTRDFELVAQSDHRMTATLFGNFKQRHGEKLLALTYFFSLFTSLRLMAQTLLVLIAIG